MRILHVLLYSSIGGIENSTRDLFSLLEARGHENVLIYDGSLLSGLEQAGRSVHRLPELASQDLSQGHRLAGRASQIIDETGCDLAYLHTTMNVVLAERILSRLPTVYFAHNYAALCPSGGLLYERGDSVCELERVPNWRCLANAYLQRCNTRRPARLWRSYQRAAQTADWARRADAIICDSEYVLRRHLENGFPRERTHVLPCPIPIPSKQALNHSPCEPLILFVGRVTPQKGLEYLIRALPKVKAPCTLVVAGDGYQLPALRRLAARLGMADRISFRGALDRAAVHELYARAAVLAVPSVWPEPYGMVGPEAMSYGVPVVGFRVGGIPDWLVDGETGFLVDPRDVTGLARSIDALLRDPALAQRLGARGREVAEERFTFDRHVDELLQVFRAAVDRRRAASTAGAVSTTV